MQKRPDARELTQLPVQSFSNWTVARVRTALNEHESGIFASSALLAEQLERNPRIGAALTTRVLGCLATKFSIAVGDGDGRRNEAALKRLRELWPGIAPTSVLNEILRWEVLLGVSLAELVWRVDGGQWVPRLKVWHPSFLHWNDMRNEWWLHTREGLVPIEPGDGRWFLHCQTSTRPWMRGVVRCLGIQDTIRGFAVRDWARYSEVHGLPIRKAVVPSDAKPENKDRYFESVARLGSEATIITPVDAKGENKFDLALIEANDQSFEGFKGLIAQCDADTAVAILGQNLTTEHAKAGGYAAARVGDGVRREYQAADAQYLGDNLQTQVSRPWARFNYGDERVGGRPTWNVEPEADRGEVATTLKTLGDAVTSLNGALSADGLRVDARKLADTFGLPVIATPKAEPAPMTPQTQPEQ